MAVDGAGNPLPHTSEEVDAIVHRALDKGEIIAAILKDEHGDLCVQVLGPPSVALLDALEQVLVAYRRILKGHA